MANEKQRKTFLSYSRFNKDFAIRLAKELKAEGFDIWLDQLDIPAGARWDREVEKALNESEIFMIILTPSSVDSENVLDEIGYAVDNGKRFLPVLLENCTVPLRLRRFQYVDFTNKSFDDGVESAKELLRSLIAQTTIPRGGIPAESQDKDAQVKEEAERSARQKAESERLAQAQAGHKDETASFAAERDKILKATTLMTQGKQLLQNGDLPEAIQVFHQILTLMPNHERTLTLLAEAEAGLSQERESSDRKAKQETESKAKQEADRLAAQKADREAKTEAERKATEIAMPVEAMPIEMRAEPVSAAPTQKKPFPMGLVAGGIVAVVVLVIAGIAISALSNRGTPATEAPVVNEPATEAPISDVGPQGEWAIFSSDQTQYLVFDGAGTYSVEARNNGTNEVLYSGGGLWGFDSDYIYYYDMDSNPTATEGFYLTNEGDTLVITSQDGSSTAEWTRISGTPFTEAPAATEAPSNPNVIFNDDFSDPNNSHWGDTSPSYFANEKFYLQTEGLNLYSPDIDFSQFGSDLVIYVNATGSEGRMGIFSRLQGDGSYYLFLIDLGLSEASIWYNDGSNFENLAVQSVTQSSVYNLTVVCVGNSLDFYLNDESLHVNDDRLTGAGQVGLYTESPSITVEVDDLFVGYP